MRARLRPVSPAGIGNIDDRTPNCSQRVAACGNGSISSLTAGRIVEPASGAGVLRGIGRNAGREFPGSKRSAVFEPGVSSSAGVSVAMKEDHEDLPPHEGRNTCPHCRGSPPRPPPVARAAHCPMLFRDQPFGGHTDSLVLAPCSRREAKAGAGRAGSARRRPAWPCAPTPPNAPPAFSASAA